jgi:hypothetical protein
LLSMIPQYVLDLKAKPIKISIHCGCVKHIQPLKA